MSNLTKPPILDETGQDILTALGAIKQNLPQGGGSNGYAPTDATEATLADDDKVPFYDTSASGKRNSTWANIKAKLKAYFDTVYATISALAGKADNVSVNAKVPSGYGAYGIPKFSQYTGISTDLENLPDVVDDISEALYGSINAHGDLFSSISAQSKGTYYNKNYNSATHTFDTTTVETDKTAVYMIDDVNDKLSTAINDHASLFNSIDAKTKGTYTEVPYDTTTHNFDESQAVTHLNEPVLNMVSMNQDGLLDAIDDHADLIGKLRVEKTLAEFNALTPAEQDDPEIVYYIPDKPSLGYPVQDDGTATDLTDGALATGRTLESWLLKRFTPVKLGVKIPATANTWDTMYLSEPISNYAILWFRAVQYGNTLGGISEPVALFKTHTGSGNRIIWMYGNSNSWQAYYVNDTQIAVVQNTVSGSIYQTEVWGIGRLV